MIYENFKRFESNGVRLSFFVLDDGYLHVVADYGSEDGCDLVAIPPELLPELRSSAARAMLIGSAKGNRGA